MNDSSVLNLTRLPARLDVRQTAQFLGFAEHDVPVLVRANLLKPLGNPQPSCCKYFSSAELEAFRQDRSWLDKASRAVLQYWKKNNAHRRQTCALDSST